MTSPPSCDMRRGDVCSTAPSPLSAWLAWLDSRPAAVCTPAASSGDCVSTAPFCDGHCCGDAMESTRCNYRINIGRTQPPHGPRAGHKPWQRSALHTHPQRGRPLRSLHTGADTRHRTHTPTACYDVHVLTSRYGAGSSCRAIAVAWAARYYGAERLAESAGSGCEAVATFG